VSRFFHVLVVSLAGLRCEVTMVKVKVTFLGQTIDFDLNRDQPLQQVVDQLCSQLNAPGNRSEYVLQLDSTKQYISAPVRSFWLLYDFSRVAFEISLCGVKTQFSWSKTQQIDYLRLLCAISS
jgi:hypothetical protein